MIQCSNPTCRAASTPPASRCKVCGTPLLYRFLLAVGEGARSLRSGTLVAGRFLVWRDRLWLDTRPDTPPPSLEKILPPVMVYLKLFYLAQHVPRPYAYLIPEETGLATPVLLLDAAPIATRLKGNLESSSPQSPEQIEAMLLPNLSQAWASGSALRQLNWLRQVASLWPALADQQVASTLLNLDDLRVDGALLRLTTLVTDETPPALSALELPWRKLVATAQPAVQEYLGWVVKALRDGKITTAADLEADLEGALQTLGQGLLVTIDWAAGTDQGPTRDRNEDACYPDGESRQQRLTGSAIGVDPPPLLLVCDGIGGHEQGSVASQTAIKLLQQELEPLTQQPHLPPAAIAQRLKQAIILANDAISARNNDEQRSARARMGTTVVVTLVHFPYVSIAHIGDSRAYRISPHTCYQITVDDDVASREAQMGYALYSEAVQLPSGGALIQALGISDSGYLYPSVQHLLLDDPALLLLCSDGLSDYDRVEALAPHLVAPLTATAGPLGTAIAELIQQANRLNGHDNVTVGLMRFIPQVATLPSLPASSLKQAPVPSQLAATGAAGHAPPPTTRLVAPAAATAPAARPGRAGFPWAAFLGGMAVVLAALGATGWFLSRRQSSAMAIQPLTTDWPIPALAGQPLPSSALAATVEIPIGSFWQATNAGDGRDLDLRQQPGEAAGLTEPGPTEPPAVAIGSIVRVISRQTTADNTDWVRLQICSIPSGDSLEQAPQETDLSEPLANNPDLSQRLSTPGDEGWMQTRQLYRATAFLELVTPTQAGRCVP
ncbi:PP2C family protein-serine/threonine phosphatase [Nodosilinea sp. E11]|uniref:PP2C family protein-serine/threonine phosphatase n=1 Tax=Nodosilinea sp. E11 TaxID=3037479 RepID=UPI0029342A3C|nr:protein phosphatase 2C domain-containing protein [Nodosilinea sp. E11]WOD40856.1 protein phosphatase 2C domain-containing protein [Nodosilinea sp. E11]